MEINLFASRLNAKLTKYVTRYRDSDAYAIDAFSMTWNRYLYYIFSSFQSATTYSTKSRGGQNKMHQFVRTSYLRFIRRPLRKQGISKQSRRLVLESWRIGTRKQYDTYFKKWLYYCEGKINPFEPHISHILGFLDLLYTNGLSYTAIGTARSAISGFMHWHST